MNLRLTRRRFGQVVIAGTATAAIAALANKTFAQSSNLVVVGVGSGPNTSNNDADTNLNNTTVDSTVDNTTVADSPQELIRQSLDVVTGQVTTLTTPQFLQDGTTPILRAGEELTGFTYLANGTPVLAITPVSTNTPTRLILLNTSPTAVTISGLTKQEKLESLLGTNDGGLIALVAKRNGTPPIKLVNVNVQTGAITNNNSVTLPANVRYIELAQSPDGKLYTISVGRLGETNLVQLDRGQPTTVAQLNVGTVLNNGLHSLIFSPAGQLFAFGNLRYQTPNSLYTIDLNSGSMTLPKDFDVAKVTILRT